MIRKYTELFLSRIHSYHSCWKYNKPNPNSTFWDNLYGLILTTCHKWRIWQLKSMNSKESLKKLQPSISFLSIKRQILFFWSNSFFRQGMPCKHNHNRYFLSSNWKNIRSVYRISSINSRGYYSFLNVKNAASIWGRPLFKGGYYYKFQKNYVKLHPKMDNFCKISSIFIAKYVK